MTVEDAIAWFENRIKCITLSGARSMYEIALSALRAQQEMGRSSTTIVAKLREFAGAKPPVCEWDKGPVYCKPYEPWQETAKEAADIIERYEKDQYRAKQEQENNAPLTLDEIKREKYVWVEPLKDWAKVTKYGLLYFGTEDYTSWGECGDLGRLWNAYRHKPAEEGTA